MNAQLLALGARVVLAGRYWTNVALMIAAALAFTVFPLATSPANGQPISVDIEIKEAEKAFFEGNFDRALRRIEKAMEEIAQPDTQRKMAQAGMDHGIQNVFARALKADILAAIGQHKQATSLIKSATDENARKRSFYIRRGINPVTLWLLEAHCELFHGDITFSQGHLGSYQIRYSMLDEPLRSSLIALLDDHDSAKHMKSSLIWYKKAIDTLENPFATGVTKSSRVAGIGSGTGNKPGTSQNTNGVSLVWEEILLEDTPDITKRLSSKCLIGLARANVCAMLLEIKTLSRADRAARALREPFGNFTFPAETSLAALITRLEEACDIPCILDKEGFGEDGTTTDTVQVKFEDVEGATLIEALAAALGRKDVSVFSTDRGLCICPRDRRDFVSRVHARPANRINLQEYFDEADGYYARARELCKERRQYKFFVDPQREFALSLKEVTAKAMESQQEGKVSRDNMTKLAAAYARTVIEWVVLEQDAAELSGLLSLATETPDQKEERVVQTKARYTKLVDLVRENFSRDHPAVFAASLSACRYRGLLATQCLEEVRAIRAGELQEREEVTCEQLDLQADIYRDEALETVSELISSMQRSLSVEHPVFLEAVCVLLECVTSGECENRQKYLDEAAGLVQQISKAREARLKSEQ